MGTARIRATEAAAPGDLCQLADRRTGSERDPIRATDCTRVSKFHRGSHRCRTLCKWSLLAAAPYVLPGFEDGVSCCLRSRNRQEPGGAATGTS